ncbi:MAG: phospho-sugar mutase [Proteobacteria bacterium]|nr:phospho-sugar mutase [Pseudomonadota bacterium]MCP4919453.1 phospho-sugar mutase [Pseudomonadota bacterium]
MPALTAARQGFSQLDVPQAVRDAALEHLAQWLTDPRTVEYVPLIEAMVANASWDLLLDSFYQVIPFGTGGRRGPVGVGPNRINPFTIGSSIQGHAEYLKARHEGDLSVVVAYDVRRFDDARGHLPGGVENPLTGITSRDFAELASEVYAGNGITVQILPRGSTSYMSTPELSFAIRHLGAHGGLNVSASHNPPDDNGAKVYNHLGGQEIPPYDEELVAIVAKVRAVVREPWADALAAGRIQAVGSDVHAAYIETNLACGRVPEARSAHVVFTALHGTGDGTVAALLTKAGFRVDLEPTQASHDGAFPNVPFGTPNPEVPQSMDRAVALARELGADLVMSCDPDADRLGLVARHGDDWRFLSGNEIATLTVRHALDNGLGGDTPVVIKTEVTSSLVERVAKARGAQVVGHLLVGFKYIGDGLHQLESTGRFHGAVGGLESFAVGTEESHGVLVTPQVRDKDAAGAALLLAEAASLQKDAGRSLVDLLEDCWAEVGYVENQLISTVMRGAVGRSRILAIQDSFRADPPTHVGAREVSAFHDRRDESGPFGPLVSDTDRAARDVLVLELGPDARLILRPSGTEPKNKVYAELAGAPGQDPAEVTAACIDMAEDFVLLMLSRAGLELPRWALKASGLLPIEKKQHLAAVVAPALAERLDAGTASREWLEAQLADYGKDAVGLVAPALSVWAASTGRSVDALI